MMKWTRIILASCAIVAALAAARAANPPEAEAAARRVMDSIGGRDAFLATRYLHFDFVVVRPGQADGRWEHSWDRFTGDYRVEGTSGTARLLTLFNVNTRKGSAWTDGRAVPADQLASRLDAAYGRFINDTYWLLMPFKMLDPGVNLSLSKPQDDEPTTASVVELSFRGVGLTPGDRYRVAADPETSRVVSWRYFLQGGRKGAATWEGWKPAGGIRLPSLHRGEGGFEIRHTVTDAPASLPAELFTKP